MILNIYSNIGLFDIFNNIYHCFVIIPRTKKLKKIHPMQKYIATFLIYFSFVANIYSQRCGSHILSEKIKSDTGFVNIQNNIQRVAQSRMANSTADVVYTIPIVVHVLYNNANQNISDAQILSQIEILNKDYRLLNNNFSSTPSAFVPLAGDALIQFALAKKDPKGLPTNGITRTFTNTAAFEFNDNMKSAKTGGVDPWNTTKYLNIWVCELTNDVLGFAYPPGAPANIDGVVINYKSFGNTGNVSYPFDLGRTATHEIGHYLNLKHIWGDSNCGDDGVNDTPTQKTSNSQCPSYPHPTCSNNSDMYVNFMDYTYDACMTMFSKGQVSRMRTALEVGRVSLLTSDALNSVSLYKNDAGIKKINNYDEENFLCSDSIAANVTLFNYGSEALKDVKIKVSDNNGELLNFNWSGNLATLNSIDINLPNVKVSNNTRFLVYTELPNNVKDSSSVNDTTSTNIMTVKSQFMPLMQDFEGAFPDPNWTIINPDKDITWEQSKVAGANKSTKSMVLKNFDYTNQNGQLDYYVSPKFKVLENSKLTFDYAYQVYTSSLSYGDTLIIYYSTDCGLTKNVLFKKGGAELITAGSSTNFFIPTENQWVNKTVSLTSLVGQTIQLYFTNKCDYENNLYLDNINVNSLTGIQDDEFAQYSLYPNPANDKISFEGINLKDIYVFDLSGKLICLNSNQNTIDVSSLQKGLYLFKGVTDMNEVVFRKFEKR